jgi:haloalkane dehalogenase
VLFTFEPGFLLPPDILEWSRANIRNLQIVPLGAGNHYVPEDQPEAIARGIEQWLKAIER